MILEGIVDSDLCDAMCGDIHTCSYVSRTAGNLWESGARRLVKRSMACSHTQRKLVGFYDH